MTSGFALGGGPPLPTNDDFQIVLACALISIGLTIFLIVFWKLTRK